MKRFTETTKWGQAWFRRLSGPGKLLWQFLNDHCDNAGVVDPDFELATFQIGQPVEEKNLAEFGDRVQRLPNGKLWLTDFIREQFSDLTIGNNLHKSAIKLIQFHNLNYPIPTCRQPRSMPSGRHPKASNGVGMASGCRSKATSKVKVKVKVNNQSNLIEQTSPHSRAGLIEGKMNQKFEALKLANLIVSNSTSWHYDNCKVEPDKLKVSSLQTVIEPFVGKHSHAEILAQWSKAVRLAHAAKVDQLARNATPYAVECFKQQLKGKINP